jgi:hypothetical protein
VNGATCPRDGVDAQYDAALGLLELLLQVVCTAPTSNPSAVGTVVDLNNQPINQPANQPASQEERKKYRREKITKHHTENTK